MTTPLYLTVALCILGAVGAYALGRSRASTPAAPFAGDVEITSFEVRAGEVIVDLSLSPEVREIFNQGQTRPCVSVEEVNEMGLTKHGHGDLLPEEGDLTKTATTEDQKQVLAALAEENDEADQ